MVHIIVASHGNYATALIEKCKRILGQNTLADVTSVSVKPSDSPEAFEKRVTAKLEAVSGEKEILVLVDLFAGTPFNVLFSVLAERGAKIVAGVNLQMTLDVLQNHNRLTASKLVERAVAVGKAAITSPSCNV